MARRGEAAVAMDAPITTDADAQQRSFYLPAIPSLSGQPGPVERLLTAVYDRNRTYLRRME